MKGLTVILVSALMAAGQWAWTRDAQASGTARYYVAFLRPDPARKALSDEEGEKLQAAHMANIHKMAVDGVLVSAGPFDDTPRTISGIFIFKVESLEKAREIAEKDPTVLAHRNTIDVHAWDGPAGIGEEYFRLHKLDPKTPENMQMYPLCMLFLNEGSGGRGELMEAHERYVEKLRTDGKLGAAGRVTGEDGMAGLVIFRPMALNEALRMMGDDPAVKGGALKVEFHQWWSSDHVLPW
jgi:uncharacterized protein YciI